MLARERPNRLTQKRFIAKELYTPFVKSFLCDALNGKCEYWQFRKLKVDVVKHNLACVSIFKSNCVVGGCVG